MLAWRNIDNLVLVPAHALVLAAGGANCRDIACTQEQVFRAGAYTETEVAFFFFFSFFRLTDVRTTGGLLLDGLLGLDETDTLGTDWVWFVIERVIHICA